VDRAAIDKKGITGRIQMRGIKSILCLPKCPTDTGLKQINSSKILNLHMKNLSSKNGHMSLDGLNNLGTIHL